jgi:hypothetical protein
MNQLRLRSSHQLKFKGLGFTGYGFREINDRSRGIYRRIYYPNLIKGKLENVHMEPVGLASTRISTDDYAQKSHLPDHCSRFPNSLT